VADAPSPADGAFPAREPETGRARDGVTVAAFDLDGTLTNGGSVLPFLVAVRGALPVAVATTRTLPPLARAAAVGGTAADAAKEQLFVRVLGGLRAGDVDAVGADFAARHIRARVRPEVQRRLHWHRDQGHRIVIVSASPECYVGPAAELLGADDFLATRLAVDPDGRLTGRYEGKNCRGSEKYARLVSWLRVNGLVGSGNEQPVLWAYGNSRGDLRLLGAADHGVDAGRLGRWGRLHQFPRLGALPEQPAAPAWPARPGR
jgi:HAD superfamily hydrolase (TIGR01490 family)